MHARCLNGNTIIGLSPQLPSLTATCQSAIFDLQNNSKYAAATTTFYSRVAPLITLGLKRIYPNLYGIDRLLPSPEPNLSCRFLSLILIPATDGSASRDRGRLVLYYWLNHLDETVYSDLLGLLLSWRASL
jgi:hypothetical protein